MNINLLYVEGTSEKLQHTQNKIHFHTESTLYKLLCKLKDWVATEDKNKNVYEIDCSNCEAVSFNESKLSLKSRWDQRKRSVRKWYR